MKARNQEYLDVAFYKFLPPDFSAGQKKNGKLIKIVRQREFPLWLSRLRLRPDIVSTKTFNPYPHSVDYESDIATSR